jgi:MFS family permease
MCGIGLLLVAGGLFVAGLTMDGYFLITGVFILAIGEILITPRITQYFSSIAPTEERSQYLGYVNLAWLFGLSGGGIIGGYLYQKLGEKSSFAIDYLNKYYNIDVTHSEAMLKLCEITGASHQSVTIML